MTETQMIEIRPFVESDFERVKAIYQEGIDTGQATFQTDAKDWHEWDASLLPHSRLVACSNGIVVGWAGLSAVSSRCVYAGVAELTIYIAAEVRGKGVGKQLLQALIAASEDAGIWTLKAGVFPENEASVQLHLKCGFKTLGRQERIGKLAGVWRDTLLLERRSNIVGMD